MECKYIKSCGSCTLNTDYENQIEYKKEFIRCKFLEFYNDKIEVFKSFPKHYRNRAEFGLFHEGSELFYTMRDKKGKRIFIEQCPKTDMKIYSFMPKILAYIKNNTILKDKIFGIEFISTKKDFMAILLYHKDVCNIKYELQKLSLNLNIKLIARSKGKKLVFGCENLEEELDINGCIYKYTFGEGSFIQPNTGINEKMISWVKTYIKNPKDLLEMYCGHGNFTVALADKFNRVLATEISKSSIKNALKNCELNNVENIDFVRISSEELMDAFNKKRKFYRLENVDLNEFDFSHVLVDPPRAGLDESVVNFIKNYENIIYVSCNPQTLYENLNEICKTHKIVKFAIFDQFPHTKHIETVALLSKLNVDKHISVEIEPDELDLTSVKSRAAYV